jgi:nitroreductase
MIARAPGCLVLQFIQAQCGFGLYKAKKGASLMNVLEAIQKRRSIRHYKPDDIPEDVRAPMAIVLGYPVAWPEPRPRKSLDEIICYDKYS